MNLPRPALTMDLLAAICLQVLGIASLFLHFQLLRLVLISEAELTEHTRIKGVCCHSGLGLVLNMAFRVPALKSEEGFLRIMLSQIF